MKTKAEHSLTSGEIVAFSARARLAIGRMQRQQLDGAGHDVIPTRKLFTDSSRDEHASPARTRLPFNDRTLIHLAEHRDPSGAMKRSNFSVNVGTVTFFACVKMPRCSGRTSTPFTLLPGTRRGEEEKRRKKEEEEEAS